MHFKFVVKPENILWEDIEILEDDTKFSFKDYRGIMAKSLVDENGKPLSEPLTALGKLDVVESLHAMTLFKDAVKEMLGNMVNPTSGK